MNLTGLHFLLTYQCIFACDHCFVWGSPQQSGVFTMADLENALDQALELGTIRSIYFEGGEPFLHYPLLVEGVRAAALRGFTVGVVTNGYWASHAQNAIAWLQPMADALSDVSVSSDLLHYDESVSEQARHALAACERLGIHADLISCEVPEGSPPRPVQGRGEAVESGDIMYRGRAVGSFAEAAPQFPWDSYHECPWEDLAAPGRVHLDPLGFLHLCQGLVMGNLFARPLSEIVAGYEPASHPIVAALLRGGPAELVRAFDLPHRPTYADACHLCYTARDQLRSRFPEWLAPGQMYGDGLT
jgi:hypothetical protein